MKIEILEMLPADRFAVLLKNGKKVRVAFWVRGRNPETGASVLTAAFPMENSVGSLVLASEHPDVKRIVPY